MPVPEDSAHAVLTLVLASIQSDAAARKMRKDFENEFDPWYNARTLSQVPKNFLPADRSGSPLVESMRSRKPMNPFAAEFLAQGVLRRLGIQTAPQKICTAAEARDMPANFVVKHAGERPVQNLTWNSGEVVKSIRSGWCLASRVVPDAASFDFVSRTFARTHSAHTQLLVQLAKTHAAKDRGFEELLAKTLGKSCEPADRFFLGFVPAPWELERIKSAMALDGKPYLRVCAARVFLGCSAPHFGNVLLTLKGELVSIDHARTNFENGDDLRMLFRFVARDSRAFDVLGGVAALTIDDIRAAVSEIPQHPACGPTEGLTGYFCERLRLWKNLFSISEGQQDVKRDSVAVTA